MIAHAHLRRNAKLQQSIARFGPDLAAEMTSLSTLSPRHWAHADDPVLKGLEHWATDMAIQDRDAGTAFVVATAALVIPHGVAAAGSEAASLGLTRAGWTRNAGAPAEEQILRASELFVDASDAAFEAVQRSFDTSRQQPIWQQAPIDDAHAYRWHAELGQLCLAAILRPANSGRADSHSYQAWPSEHCVGRGVVVALRGMRRPGVTSAMLIQQLRAELTAPA